MARLAIFCDGTWNRLDSRFATNVVKLAESVESVARDGVRQLVFYDDGVGSGTAVAKGVDKLIGGATGKGLLRNIEDAYRFLIFNHQPGDEIYVFGFSRGAFTARSLCGLIRNCGIIQRRYASRVDEAIALYRDASEAGHPNGEQALEFRARYAADHILNDRDIAHRKAEADPPPRLRVDFLGVWDTVGSLGLPDTFITGLFQRNEKFAFHDTQLSAMIRAGRHAVAIDEKRESFSPTLWTPDESHDPETVQQAWFPGDHGSVGGGGDITGLSDAALLWIAEGALEAGLEYSPLPDTPLRTARPDHRAALENISSAARKGGLTSFITRRLPKKDRLAVLEKAYREEVERLKKLGRAELAAELKPPRIAVEELAASAVLRWNEAAENLAEGEPYRPGTLDGLKDLLEGAAALAKSAAERLSALAARFQPSG